MISMIQSVQFQTSLDQKTSASLAAFLYVNMIVFQVQWDIFAASPMMILDPMNIRLLSTIKPYLSHYYPLLNHIYPTIIHY